MKRLSTLTLILSLFIGACQQAQKPVQHSEVIKEEPKETQQTHEEISFHTSDGILITGDLYHNDKSAISILLCHQAGANARGEYHSIIPRLVKDGFNVLAIDQRVGGERFGSTNRTAARIKNNEYGYCDAYSDMSAALDYMIVEGYHGKHIVWGSSYSAALAIQLGNNRAGDVTGVLAFSPASGAPLADCMPNQYLGTFRAQLLILRPAKEMESKSAKEQFEIAELFGHQTYVAENGVHGSSMLVEERTQHDVSEVWDVVMTFLNKFKNR